MTGLRGPSVVVLTCVFVVWMCFLTLVTASLLEEESSTLHHEEALAKTAKANGGVKQKSQRSALSCSAAAAAQYSLYQPVLSETEAILSWTGTLDMNDKMNLDYAKCQVLII